jgi:hypothetical protein
MNDKVERSGPGWFETHCVLLPRFSLSIDAATSASSSLLRLAIAKVQSGHPPCMLRWRPSSLETTRDNALLRVSQLFGNCCASIIMAPSLAHLTSRSKAMISTIEMVILPGRPQAFGFGPRNLGCCTVSNQSSLFCALLVLGDLHRLWCSGIDSNRSLSELLEIEALQLLEIGAHNTHTDNVLPCVSSCQDRSRSLHRHARTHATRHTL